MSRVFSAIVFLAWALWLGGMVMLFVSLGRIFTTPGFDRETAGAFAARLFPTFERMQLIFAALALIGTVGWWLSSRASLKLVLFALFAVATVLAVVESTMITPKVEAMRVAGERGTSAFDRMHTISSRVYVSGAGVLLVAGLVLPFAVYADGRAHREIIHEHGSSGNGFPVEPEEMAGVVGASRTGARA